MTEKEEIAKLKYILGTLIAWLDMELGRHNVNKLLDLLNDDNSIGEWTEDNGNQK